MRLPFGDATKCDGCGRPARAVWHGHGQIAICETCATEILGPLAADAINICGPQGGAMAIGSILSWQCSGLPVILAGTRARAAKLAARILYLAAKHRWQEARRFAAAIQGDAVSELEPSQ